MPCSYVSVDLRRSTMPVPLNSRSVLDNEYGRMKYTYSSSCARRTSNTSEDKSHSKYTDSRLSKSSSRSSASAEDKSEGREAKTAGRSSASCYESSKNSPSSHQQRKSSYTTFDLNEYRSTYAPGSYLAGSSRSNLGKHSPSIKPTVRLRGAALQAATVDKARRADSSDSSSSTDEDSRLCRTSMTLRKCASNSFSSDTAGLSGLLNIGNTCFLNSVVQCLSNTRLLKDYLVSREYARETRVSDSKGALIRAFADVVSELWSGEGKVVNTIAFKQQIQRYAPRFMGYNQQDSQEFLRYLLEGIHDDINRVTTKPKNLPELDDSLSDSVKATESWKQYVRIDNSKIVELFVGQLKSTLQCTTCGHKSNTFEAFWDLSLPLPTRGSSTLRLSQCLDHFTKEEVLDGNEMPTCSKCKSRRKCTKRFSIQKLPKILVLHLKRFSPSERYRKLSAAVDFPLTGLDMSPYTSSQQSCVYNLYAVSNHSGSTHSGHYTAYCLHSGTRQWYEFNDSRVSQISPRNVISSEAYILFYEQASTSPRIST